MGGMAPSNLEIALFKQYPFDSAVQRMTVVAKKKGAQYYSVFIKGAPEKVASFCRSETSKMKVLCLLTFDRDRNDIIFAINTQYLFLYYPHFLAQLGAQEIQMSAFKTEVCF